MVIYFFIKIYSEKLNWKSISKLKNISWENFNYKRITEPPQQTNRKPERKIENDNYYSQSNHDYHLSTTNSSIDTSYKVYFINFLQSRSWLIIYIIFKFNRILREQELIKQNRFLSLIVIICTNQIKKKILNELGYCVFNTKNSKKPSSSS